MRRSKGKLNFTVSPWRTTSLCPAQLHFCVSKNFTKQKKRVNGLKTVNSLYYLSQVSHLFYKCIGLCPYPYFISPIRTSRFGVCGFSLYDKEFFGPYCEVESPSTPGREPFHPQNTPVAGAGSPDAGQFLAFWKEICYDGSIQNETRYAYGQV